MEDRWTFADEFRALGRAGDAAAALLAGGREDYRIAPAPLTRILDEGDVIDLGDRSFTVLHLPGHSFGCIGLYDERDGLLFSRRRRL